MVSAASVEELRNRGGLRMNPGDGWNGDEKISIENR